MSQEFDPYYKWLGIAPKDQPPHHYRLLGIDVFEDERDVIDAAANRVMSYLRELAAGDDAAYSQELLNEVAKARVCLLNPGKKAMYDGELRAKVTRRKPVPREKLAPPLETRQLPTDPWSESTPKAFATMPRLPVAVRVEESPGSEGERRQGWLLPSIAGIVLLTSATVLLAVALIIGRSDSEWIAPDSTEKSKADPPVAWDRSPSGSVGATFVGEEIRLEARPEQVALASVREMYKDFEMEVEFEWLPQSHAKTFNVELPFKFSGAKSPVDRTEIMFWPEARRLILRTWYPTLQRPHDLREVDWTCSGSGPVRAIVRRTGAVVEVFCDGEHLSISMPKDLDPKGPRQIRLYTWQSQAVVRNVRIRDLP